MAVDPGLEAPLVQGQVLGELRVSFESDVIATRPMVVLETVREGSLWQRASDSVRADHRFPTHVDITLRCSNKDMFPWTN